MTGSPGATGRFLLILSFYSNLLRAALVTRELRIVASAQLTFEIRESDDGESKFDNDEVWYKTKRVIAACLDIGRTETREIAALALVTPPHGQPSPTPLQAWLVRNLSGADVMMDRNGFPKTLARSPLDAELPIVGVLNEQDALGYAPSLNVPDSDRVMLGAASHAWQTITKKETSG